MAAGVVEVQKQLSKQEHCNRVIYSAFMGFIL